MSTVTAIPFRAGGALTPEETAFAESVYDEDAPGRLRFSEIRNFVPKVICSPKLTGKSTQLNYLAVEYERFGGAASVQRIDIDLAKERGEIGEEELLALLGQSLAATDRETIRSVIASAAALTKDVRTLVAIGNAERLPTPTLRWLLANIRILNEEHTALLLSRSVQIVIDGSFSLQTLTAGPDSEFPMSQLYPPEFGPSGQREFLRARLAKFNLTFSREAFGAFFEATLGDKYLTQELALQLALRFGDAPTRRVVDATEIQKSVDQFVGAAPHYHALGRSLAQGLRALNTLYRGNFAEVLRLMPRVKDEWRTLPREVRDTLYKSGLVRRTGATEVQLRAPIVMKIIERAAERLEAVREILETGFSVPGVVNAQKTLAEGVVSSIEEACLHGTLVTLHAGPGRWTGTDIVESRMVALDRGEYSARLRLGLPADAHIGDERWILLWVYEPEPGVRRSELRTFPVLPAGEVE